MGDIDRSRGGNLAGNAELGSRAPLVPGTNLPRILGDGRLAVMRSNAAVGASGSTPSTGSKVPEEISPMPPSSESSEPLGVTFIVKPAKAPLRYPVRSPEISSNFGSRNAPRTRGGGRGSKNHNGTDLVGADNILAPAAGLVVSTGQRPKIGKFIIVVHDGLEVDGKQTHVATLYGHLHSIHVKPGQPVKEGAKIGVMGSTGNVTGKHLHFQTALKNDSGWVWVDPRRLLGESKYKTLTKPVKFSIDGLYAAAEASSKGTNRHDPRSSNTVASNQRRARPNSVRTTESETRPDTEGTALASEIPNAVTNLDLDLDIVDSNSDFAITLQTSSSKTVKKRK